MRAGQLRHYVTVQAHTSAQNDYGEKAMAWTSNIKQWAAIWPLRGEEYLSAKGMQANVTHRIRMRHTTLAASTEITKNNARIKYDDRIFNIEAIINVDERNIYYDIMCNEEV